MNAPLQPQVRHLAHAALVCALVVGLPDFDLETGQGPFGFASASAATDDPYAKAEKKLWVREMLKPYTRDVRRAIRDEWQRIGKTRKNLLIAIDTVLSGGGGSGGGNSTIKRDAFAQTVFPIVRANCRSCHAGSGPGFPAIAHADASAAYDAVVVNQKVRLNDPVRSRIVQRLSNDQHYCWSDCNDDGTEMQDAVAQWAALEDAAGSTIDVNAITSSSSSMGEGKLDKKRGRKEDHVIAKWEFKTGSGNTAYDTSGVGRTMDLELENVTWLSNYGIQFDDDDAIARATPDASRKLFKKIANANKGTQQYSIEAWIANASVDLDGPARIVSYSNGTSLRNFMLGQNLYNYVARTRTKSRDTDRNGDPSLQTDDDAQRLQATLQHVVVTYDRVRGRRIWVNGEFTGDKDPASPSFLTSWNRSYRFVVGNETGRNRPWKGQMRFLAIHKVALTGNQIRKNFSEGVGQKFLVKFNLDNWLTTTGNWLQLSVQELDEYSYLFCEPRFIGPPPLDYRAEGMRVAINGLMAVSGQAFTNVEAIISQSKAEVSRLCSVIPKEQGKDNDRFSIYFERLGDYQNVFVEPPPDPLPDVDDPDNRPDIGLRPFEQINATMASVTGVDPLVQNVRDTFNLIRQQLPSEPEARGFVASHQVGVSKLSLDYCDTMVDDPALRSAFFGTNPGFEFDSPVPTAFSSQAKRDVVIDALYDRMIGTGIASQPTRAEVGGVLDTLIDDLTAGCDATSCPAVRTRTTVKAACAAVLSSAAILIH